MTPNEEMVIFTRTFDFLSWLLPMTADPWVSWQFSPCPSSHLYPATARRCL
jgi:hypothetical protein